MKIKEFFKRLWYGKPKPPLVYYIEIKPIDHPKLKPNKEEYRFPELYSPPKVKFKLAKQKKKTE